MRDTKSITDIKGNAWGTMFLEGDTGSVWYVSREHAVTNLFPSGVTEIAVGYNHCVVVTQYGEALTFHNVPDNESAWRYSSKGQHGVGDYEFQPMEVMSVPVANVVRAQCGVNWTVLLDRDGVLWFAGDNTHGVAGIGKDSISERRNELCERIFLPVRDNLKTVQAGPNHCFVIDKQGEMFFSGRNVCSAGGFDHTSKYAHGSNEFVSTGMLVKEVQTSHRKSLAVDTEGHLWHVGDARHSPGYIKEDQPFRPRDTWGMVSDCDLESFVLTGDVDGVGLTSAGDMVVCGTSKMSGKYGKSHGSLFGIAKTGERGDKVAVTEGATFVRRDEEWFSSGPARTPYALGPLDGTIRHSTGGTGFFKTAHPAVWELALSFSSMGIPWNEAVDAAASVS